MVMVIVCFISRHFNDGTLGDTVEACLAAANAAADHFEGRPRTWAGLRGGARGPGDLVTRWIVRAVTWEFADITV